MSVGGRRLQQAVFICAAGLLLYACYDYGALLRPSRTVMAIAVPALGLLWFLGRGAQWWRARSREAAGAVPAYAVKAAAVGWRLLAAPLLGLALFGALSAVWSLDRADSLRASGILFGGLFYLYLGWRVGGASSIERRTLLGLVTAVGTVISVLSVTGYALRWWRFSLAKDGVLAATGTFGYANALAGLLLLTLAATIALGLNGRDRSQLRSTPPAPSGRSTPSLGDREATRRLVLAAAIGIQIAALVLTWSKGAAVVAGFLLLLWPTVRAFYASDPTQRNRRLGVALALLFLAGLAAGGVLLWRDVAPQMAVSGLPPSGTDPQDLVPMTSNAFRIKTWAAALDAAAERPLAGWGLGTFYEAYAPFKLGGHTAYAHNVVIHHLVEVGGIGTALLLAFLVVAALSSRRILLGPAGDPRVPLALGAQAFALHNLVDLTWYFPALFFIFALLLGLVVAPSAPPGAASTSVVAPATPPVTGSASTSAVAPATSAEGASTSGGTASGRPSGLRPRVMLPVSVRARRRPWIS